MRSPTRRLRLSRRHYFTWIGYERLDESKAFLSAMVPSRCLDNTSWSTKFKIEYQVYLLNIFPFDLGTDILPMTPEHDYMNFLPIKSLMPFERENFFYLENSEGSLGKTGETKRKKTNLNCYSTKLRSKVVTQV